MAAPCLLATRSPCTPTSRQKCPSPPNKWSGLVPRYHQQRYFLQCRATAAHGSTKPHTTTCADSRTQAERPFIANRRAFLGMLLAPLVVGQSARAETALVPSDIRPALAPDQSRYNPADPTLREAAALLQQGLNATDVVEEERIWTQIIDKYGDLDEPWVPDVVGRAWGNRGNARSRQGKLDAALADYNTAIRICPWSVDPVLNRGVVLEALGRFGEAVADYRAVLAVAPQDPAAWNNLGNATGGLGEWSEALEYYGKAASLAPNFAFASANRALALFQVGKEDAALREMRSVLRRYPDFPDMRAALAAALWAVGKEGDAESNWERVDDPRYKDLKWLRSNRRWPPRLFAALDAFLQLKSV